MKRSTKIGAYSVAALLTVFSVFQNCSKPNDISPTDLASAAGTSPKIIASQQLLLAGSEAKVSVILENIKKDYTLNWKITPDNTDFTNSQGSVDVKAGDTIAQIDLTSTATSAAVAPYALTITESTGEISPVTLALQEVGGQNQNNGLNLQIVKASGSWTVPNGVTLIRLTAVGGGGGSGGGGSAGQAGGATSISGPSLNCALPLNANGVPTLTAAGGGGSSTAYVAYYTPSTAGAGGAGSGGAVFPGTGGGAVGCASYDSNGNCILPTSVAGGRSGAEIGGFPYTGYYGEGAGGMVSATYAYISAGGGGAGAAIAGCSVTQGSVLTIAVGLGGAGGSASYYGAGNVGQQGVAVIQW